jgi:hypothetical protein
MNFKPILRLPEPGTKVADSDRNKGNAFFVGPIATQAILADHSIVFQQLSVSGSPRTTLLLASQAMIEGDTQIVKAVVSIMIEQFQNFDPHTQAPRLAKVSEFTQLDSTAFDTALGHIQTFKNTAEALKAFGQAKQEVKDAKSTFDSKHPASHNNVQIGDIFDDSFIRAIDAHNKAEAEKPVNPIERSMRITRPAKPSPLPICPASSSVTPLAVVPGLPTDTDAESNEWK